MTAAGPRQHEPRVLRGIAFVVAATVLFVVMNGAVKHLSHSLPTVELIWARTLVHLLFVGALFAPARGGWPLLATRRPAIQVSRSLLLLVSTSFFFSAIGHVPLADATAVSFTSPFVVAILAARVLRERVTREHWISIAVGFVGALIVIRPTGAGTTPALLLVLGSACCYALYQVLTRRVVGIDSAETSVTYSALVGTLVLSALVPFVWRTPQGAVQWLMLGTLGLLGGLGHYCVARALLWGPASVVAPFHYVQLVWAAVLGYLVFGDVPSAWTWVGAAIIVVSGLALAWHETRAGG
jgi:drug/metabolite transporter (DMT)-like permease